MPEMPPMPPPPPPPDRIDGFLITLGHDLRSFGDEKGVDVMHDISNMIYYVKKSKKYNIVLGSV